MPEAISEDTILVMDADGKLKELPDPDLLSARNRLNTTETFEDVFSGIYSEALEILIERQKKYGPNNIRQLGLYGVFSRLAFDKIERVRRSLNGRVVNGDVILDLGGEDFADESFEDALFDIANYALIIIALRRGQWGRPMADEVARDAA